LQAFEIIRFKRYSLDVRFDHNKTNLENAMKTARFFTLAMLFIFSAAAVLRAEEDPSQKLAQLEAKIKEKPDDPMLYYRKAQCLMDLKKYDEGYDTAKQAMEKFVKAKRDLAWMMLENVDLGNVRVEVLFNMGPRERNPPDIGIVKPLSFRVWKKEGRQLLGSIDFEIGYMQGKPGTAALGQEVGGSHGNFGMLKTDEPYHVIREKALETIKKRFLKSEETGKKE
jgi:tetratricopeptide (TPR) repeat protein